MQVTRSLFGQGALWLYTVGWMKNDELRSGWLNIARMAPNASMLNAVISLCFLLQLVRTLVLLTASMDLSS